MTSGIPHLIIVATIALSPVAMAQQTKAQSPDSVLGQATSCEMQIGGLLGVDGTGTVVGFLSEQQALALREATQSAIRGSVNPAYLDNPRAVVHPDRGAPNARAVKVVPRGMEVKVGDHVHYSAGRPDTSLPCHYVPPLITEIDGPQAFLTL